MTYNMNRRDRSEDAIVDLWRRLGFAWIPQPRTAGFDGILVTPHRVAIVEVKNPETRDELTERERKTKAEVEAAGGEYFIVWDDATALEAAGVA